MNIDKFQYQSNIPFFWEDTQRSIAFCDLRRKQCHIFRKYKTECCLNFLQVTNWSGHQDKSLQRQIYPKSFRLKQHKLCCAIFGPGVDAHVTVDETALDSDRFVVVYNIHNIVILFQCPWQPSQRSLFVCTGNSLCQNPPMPSLSQGVWVLPESWWQELEPKSSQMCYFPRQPEAILPDWRFKIFAKTISSQET